MTSPRPHAGLVPKQKESLKCDEEIKLMFEIRLGVYDPLSADDTMNFNIGPIPDLRIYFWPKRKPLRSENF